MVMDDELTLSDVWEKMMKKIWAYRLQQKNGDFSTAKCVFEMRCSVFIYKWNPTERIRDISYF